MNNDRYIYANCHRVQHSLKPMEYPEDFAYNERIEEAQLLTEEAMRKACQGLRILGQAFRTLAMDIQRFAAAINKYNKLENA